MCRVFNLEFTMTARRGWHDSDIESHNPDDSICACCGTALPDEPDEDSWAYNGFCDAVCCVREFLRNPMALRPEDWPSHFHMSYRKMVAEAMSELMAGLGGCEVG